MDISQEYIDMCRQATEIQPGPEEPGSWWYGDDHGEVEVQGSNWDESRLRTDISLFTQDQLQKMIPLPPHALVAQFSWFCNVCEATEGWDWGYKAKYLDPLTSMEQLWLAYVMWVKFGKVWDSAKEEWVTAPADPLETR